MKNNNLVSIIQNMNTQVSNTFLIIGDPHFKTSNVPDTDEFIAKTIKLAQTESPNAIIILGDVLHEHERLHTIPLNKAYEFVRSMAIIAKTFILVGNHDMINNQQFLNTNHWMNAMKQWNNVTIVDTPISFQPFPDSDNFFVLCPYVPNGRLIEALDHLGSNTADESIDWRDANLIFAHQEFNGCKMGAIESIDGDVWSKNLPPVISGHIHSNQKLLDGHIYYPGSAMQNAFGDPNNILAVIDWNRINHDTQFDITDILPPYVCKEVDLKLRKKKIIYMELDEIETHDCTQMIDSNDLIKLTLSGNYDDFKIFRQTPKYKLLSDSGIKIIHKNKRLKPSELDNTASQELTESPEHPSSIFNDDSGESINKLVHTLVHQTAEQQSDSHIISDFNYLFLGYKKDEERFCL